MSAAAAVGGMLGSGIGKYAGGAMGGAVGELFGPEAVPLGAYLGSKAGSYVGGLAGEWLASKMEGADQKAETNTQTKTVCKECSKSCTQARLDELTKKKDDVCRNVFTNAFFQSQNPKKRAKLTCSDFDQRIKDMEACRDARQQIQDECYKDNPDPNHNSKIGDYDRGIENLKNESDLRGCSSYGAGV